MLLQPPLVIAELDQVRESPWGQPPLVIAELDQVRKSPWGIPLVYLKCD